MYPRRPSSQMGARIKRMGRDHAVPSRPSQPRSASTRGRYGSEEGYPCLTYETSSGAGGTVSIPNNVYNRFLGIKRGPQADSFKLELQPELAQSWQISPDGLSYTFKVDSRAKWQNLPPLNGRSFTAEDARYALD